MARSKRDSPGGRIGRAVCGRNLGSFARMAPRLFADADRVCFVTDRTAWSLFRGRFERMLGVHCPKTDFCVLPSGGSLKTFRTLEGILSFLLQRGCSRRSVLVAAGGGAITDVAGLAAALYMRAIRWVAVPTTLLGQIDAGLGGKTAVDLGGVKNAVGAYHQPALTVCDAAFLETLGPDGLRAGMGELFKYALIGPPALRRLIQKNLEGLSKAEMRPLTAVLKACVEFKLSVVAKDERDEAGARMLLNLGHTAGHAFESLARGGLLHGDAVLWGLRYAHILSLECGTLERGSRRFVRGLLWGRPAPPLPRACGDFAAFHALVRRDKKVGARTNRFLLMVRPGVVRSVDDLPPRVLREALARLKHANRPSREAL